MLRKWTRETIVEAILDLHDAGDSLCYTAILTDRRALLQAAVRYFGTWEGAVTAAGLDYDSFRRHRKPGSDPDIVVRIRPRRRTYRKISTAFAS